MGVIYYNMNKLRLGILLIVMMFGHNFVLNQTQTMQSELEKIHHISVTQFNLLYSIPSALSILVIIPLGFLYDRCEHPLLIAAALALSFGQLITALFSNPNPTSTPTHSHYFDLMVGGRVFEGIGAEILYMIQGNMASSWMGKYAGLVFILPEVGEVANVFITPLTLKHWGVQNSFMLGFVVCLVSTAACFLVYWGLRKRKVKEVRDVEMDSMAAESGREVIERGEEMRLEDEKGGQVGKEGQGEAKREVEGQKSGICSAGRVYWLVTLLCGINECLYFPFLDNINELISDRFCIPFEDTGYYLSIPFISAMLTSALSSLVTPHFERKTLMLLISVIPLIGHSVIYSDFDCDANGETPFGKFILVLGFIFFGVGIGSYYSVSFAAVGLSIPSEIRGMGYAVMGFFQTISMTLIPLASGYIVESEQKLSTRSHGYKESSLLFVSLCLAAVVVSALIYWLADSNSFIYNDEDNLVGDEESQHLNIEEENRSSV